MNVLLPTALFLIVILENVLIRFLLKLLFVEIIIIFIVPRDCIVLIFLVLTLTDPLVKFLVMVKNVLL